MNGPPVRDVVYDEAPDLRVCETGASKGMLTESMVSEARTFLRTGVSPHVRGGGHCHDDRVARRGLCYPNSSRVEICIAVADWARGPTTWVLSVPVGGSTGASRTEPPWARSARSGAEAGVAGAWG
ncbi:hypothetical protein GCM10010273_32370 [Streptomyces lavendulocolor]